MSTIRSTTIAKKPVIASSLGPSELAASSTAWATNHVRIEVPKAATAPRTTGRRRERFAPRNDAVTAAKMSTASRPSRKTMIDELNTAEPWLCLTVVGSTGPVVAVAMRYTSPATTARPATQSTPRAERPEVVATEVVEDWTLLEEAMT